MIGFKPEKFIEEAVKEIKNSVDGNVIIAWSGGVDSTTTAVLVNKAVGERLLCIFVDTGFMRKNEPERMKEVGKALDLRIKMVDAKNRFLSALKGVKDPEKKRKICGELFIRIFEEEARNFEAKYLAQGTIAPDWIESGGGIRDTIKSHHNVGGLPEKMGLKLIEPLRELYKDEVRKVGKVLGIPKEIYTRQPFPGPGLAIRIVGEVTEERVNIIREACAITEKEIESAVAEGKMERPWQYFAVLLPTKSVGVHGDVRAYGYTVVIRAVDSIDGMSAAYSKIPHEVLQKISTKITNELKDRVTRVVYDITNKPPGTIEYI
ncbi:MAG: glutamine-hydrolyzing GMP synthase subunit GuaA [Candidatus Aenigmatarchaeota archaeon]|nr:MAG: glutamine-hydrolyzing GMP synthase subunit GuaA [Candidatus Aenigmarchaeota archaeon]